MNMFAFITSCGQGLRPAGQLLEATSEAPPCRAPEGAGNEGLGGEKRWAVRGRQIRVGGER